MQDQELSFEHLQVWLKTKNKQKVHLMRAKGSLPISASRKRPCVLAEVSAVAQQRHMCDITCVMLSLENVLLSTDLPLLLPTT